MIALLDERLQASERTRRLGGVPLMLAEIMSERLDRLPGGRRIVQAAACIGRSFEPSFLLAVLDDEASRVAQPLDALVTAELLQPKRRGAEVQYEFRHALLQQMAYESMVHVERRAMHDRIVEVLRQRASTHPALPEVMAHHLTEAGRTREAVEAWRAAGANAATRSAHVEAIDHLRKGLGLLSGVEDLEQRRGFELGLQVSLIGSIIATQGATSPDLSACCKRGLELCEQGPSSPLVFPFVFGEFAFVNCCGHADEGERLARLFLSLSERGELRFGNRDRAPDARPRAAGTG